MVSLHQSECHENSVQEHLVKYIMDEFCGIPGLPAQLKSVG